MLDTRRRHFIAFLGGAAAAWPLAARAQQAAMPLMGLLSGGSDSLEQELLASLRQGLSETGYIEGQNVRIEYRGAEFQYDRLPALAADLVKRGVDVIVTCVGTNAGLAARAVTSSIPIVVITGDDLVRVGLVASLNRPGGNVTGVSAIPTALGPKRLELLRALIPKAGAHRPPRQCQFSRRRSHDAGGPRGGAQAWPRNYSSDGRQRTRARCGICHACPQTSWRVAGRARSVLRSQGR